MRIAALLAALALLGAAPAPAPPRRIVSLNLCADQYLVALADREQIAALTNLARDPAMSPVAVRARAFPTIRGSAEEVLALRADLVIAAPGLRTATQQAIDARRTPMLPLPPADSYAQIVAQTRLIARAIGHPDRGEALVRRMDAALARVPRNAGRGMIAAHYQRRGYLTGTGTLVDELMRRIGLVNLAARLGKPMLAHLSLEEMALARPDLLVLDAGSARIVDQGTEALSHPVLRRIPRVRVPEAWTICGGPAYVLAAASLARQVAAIRR